MTGSERPERQQPQFARSIPNKRAPLVVVVLGGCHGPLPQTHSSSNRAAKALIGSNWDRWGFQIQAPRADCKQANARLAAVPEPCCRDDHLSLAGTQPCSATGRYWRQLRAVVRCCSFVAWMLDFGDSIALGLVIILRSSSLALGLQR